MSIIFVSHASEDKDDFVRPLAHALKKYGLKIWYDEFVLRPGDSLRRSIDKGLADCSAGIVVLSDAFFSKEWPQRELDALFAAEIAGRSQLFPVWHAITADKVAKFSPLLADKFAYTSEQGAEEIASKIAQIVPITQKITSIKLALIISNSLDSGLFASELVYTGCLYRFFQIQAISEEYYEIVIEAYDHLSDEQIEEQPPEIENFLVHEKNRLHEKFNLPQDMYLMLDGNFIREEAISWWREWLRHWALGTLSRKESKKLFFELDAIIDVDQYYVLFGIPNFSISLEQRDLLDEAAILRGCYFGEGTNEIEQICNDLRMLVSQL